MVSQEKIVLSSKAAAMLNFCQSNRYVLLGVGKNLPWPVEGTPPLVDESTLSVPELKFFVQTTLTYGLVEDEQGSVVLPDGSTYSQNYTANTEEIVLSNAFNILIEASINHNLIPSSVNSYRAFGVYTNCSFLNSSSLENSIIPVEEVVEGTLDSLLYFPPVVKQINTVQNVKLIRSFI